MFGLKDKVIYPGHGVAVIDDIIEKQVAGAVIKFFKLVFVFKDMNILIPVNNLAAIGVRYPSDSENINSIIKDFYKIPEKKLQFLDFTPSGWNRRNKEYQLKIQGGKLQDLAQIYKDLMYISKYKDLSFGEKSLLQMAEDLIVQEILVASVKSKQEILNDLHEPFKSFYCTDIEEVQHEEAATGSF